MQVIKELSFLGGWGCFTWLKYSCSAESEVPNFFQNWELPTAECIVGYFIELGEMYFNLDMSPLLFFLSWYKKSITFCVLNTSPKEVWIKPNARKNWRELKRTLVHLAQLHFTLSFSKVIIEYIYFKVKVINGSNGLHCYFLPLLVAWEMLTPQLRTEPMSPAMEMQSLNYWTNREFCKKQWALF